MAQRGTIQVENLRSFNKLLLAADKDARKYSREAFRQVGDIVKHDASQRFAGIDAKSAAGYRTRVRQRGVEVEQSLRKTTGKHPEFGALQMRRALVPALVTNAPKVERELDRAFDRVAANFNRIHP